MTSTSDSCDPPRCVADALELGHLSDSDDGIDPDLLRAFYAHCRNEDGQRVLIDKDPSFPRAWVDLNSGQAREIVQVFVAVDDTDDPKKLRHIAKANLEAIAWNDVLGIDAPPIELRIKVHGAKWAARFQSSGSTMRGRELINEQLPPAEKKPAQIPQVSPTLPEPAQDVEPLPDLKPADPTDALRKGGFPS